MYVFSIIKLYHTLTCVGRPDSNIIQKSKIKLLLFLLANRLPNLIELGALVWVLAA